MEMTVALYIPLTNPGKQRSFYYCSACGCIVYRDHERKYTYKLIDTDDHPLYVYFMEADHDKIVHLIEQKVATITIIYDCGCSTDDSSFRRDKHYKM